MHDLLTREELESLKQSDFEQYKQEIEKDWKTQAEDIAKIKSIIASFDNKETNHTITLGDKKFPLWAIDAYQYFEAKYGSLFGSVVFEKVLSKIWGDIDPSC